MSLVNFKKNVPTIQDKSNPFLSLRNELNKAASDFYGWFESFNFPGERFEAVALHPAIDIVDEK